MCALFIRSIPSLFHFFHQTPFRDLSRSGRMLLDSLVAVADMDTAVVVGGKWAEPVEDRTLLVRSSHYAPLAEGP